MADQEMPQTAEQINSRVTGQIGELTPSAPPPAGHGNCGNHCACYLRGVVETEVRTCKDCYDAGVEDGKGELADKRARGAALAAVLKPLLAWARSERVMRFGMATTPLAEELFEKADKALDVYRSQEPEESHG